jgi:WD40 repeat protein
VFACIQITDVKFSPDGFLLASGARDGEIKLWDMRGGKLLHTFQACSGPVQELCFNPQEFLLAAATSDRMVKLYDVEELQVSVKALPRQRTRQYTRGVVSILNMFRHCASFADLCMSCCHSAALCSVSIAGVQSSLIHSTAAYSTPYTMQCVSLASGLLMCAVVVVH